MEGLLDDLVYILLVLVTIIFVSIAYNIVKIERKAGLAYCVG